MNTPVGRPDAPWRPTGPPATVVTFRPWARFGVGAVMTVMVVGLVIAVARAVRAGDPGEPFRGSDVHGAGVVIGWILVTVIGLLLVMALGMLLRFRVELWPDGFVARAYVRRYVVGLDEVRSIDVRRGRRAGYDPIRVTPVLAVKARDHAGRRRGFLLTGSYQRMDGALAVLDAWVRRRPDLLTGAARPTFEARGTVAPRTSTTPPPIGGFGTVTGGHWRPDGSDAAAAVATHQLPADPDRPGRGVG